MNLSKYATPASSGWSNALYSSRVDVTSRPRMTPMSRLETSSVAGSSSRYQSIVEEPAQEERLSSETITSPRECSHRNAFHTATDRSIPSSFSTESSERLPSYSSAITVLPVREVGLIAGSPATFVSRPLSTLASDGGETFVTPMTPPRLPPRRYLAADTTGIHTAPSIATVSAASNKASSSYTTTRSTVTAKGSAPFASPVEPRGKVVAPSAATDFFTASEGSGSYVTAQSDARDPFRSITPSSISHAAYSLEHTASEMSVITVSHPAKPTTRIPMPSVPSSSSSSTTTCNSSNSSSTSTTRPGTLSTTTASSSHYLPRRILETVIGNEKARLGDTTAIASQLNRIETAVADIGNFLSVSPASVRDAQSAATFRRSQNAPSPGSPSSPSSSSSSSSDTETLPGTPTEDDRLFRDLASIKEQNRALMKQQLKVQSLLEAGGEHANTSTLGRIEDLLLRLLERSGDSAILMELGLDVAQTRQGNKSGYAASIRSKHKFAHEESMYSDEHGARAPAPAPSIDTQYERERRARMSGVPESLLEMSSHLTDELDEDWELQNLPPTSPDVDMQSRPRAMPPIGMLTRREVQPGSSHSSSEAETPPIVEPPAGDQFVGEEDTPRPNHGPIMFPQPTSTESESETTTSTTPSPRRRPFRPGPTPRPVEIPSPVRPEGYPSVMPPPSFRPGMPYPRPSRLASGREPMTTT